MSHFLHSGVPPSVDIDLLKCGLHQSHPSRCLSLMISPFGLRPRCSGESAEALQYHVDDLWLQMNRGLFDTGGW